eukprot:s3048_g7.t1
MFVPVLLEASAADASARQSVTCAALVRVPCSGFDLCTMLGLRFRSQEDPRCSHCCIWFQGQAHSLEDLLHVGPGAFLTLGWRQQEIAQLPLKVDFSSVIQAHEVLDSHVILPRYDLPGDFPWHPASWDWVNTAWWTPGMPCHEMRIYYDGSSRQVDVNRIAGCATAIFIRIDACWFFAGALSTALPNGTTSYSAELFAAVLVHKFAHDVLNLSFVSKHHNRELNSAMTRKLWAHIGEPGNELVDCLASQAALGHPLDDYTDWLAEVTRPGFVEAAEWIWYLFRPDITWSDQSVLFPAGPMTCPDVSVFPASLPVSADADAQATGDLRLSLATCNVLSLKGGSVADRDLVQQSGSGPARQEALLRQYHDSEIHIFAWQETRLRRMSNHHDDRYLLFRSPANSHGHYGIVIGLHRQLPIGTITQGSKVHPVYLKDKIVSSDPRSLILRISNPLLHCILIAGHAPHTGADAGAITEWWNSVAAAIPSKYQNCDRVILVDANARIISWQ